MSNQVLQFFVSVGKTVSELNASLFVGFEEVGEAELMQVGLLYWGVGYFGASSAPLWGLLDFSVAYFHALVIETIFFGEALDDEVDFSFESFAGEIEPGGHPVGGDFLIHVNFIGGWPDLFYVSNISWFEVAFEDGIAKFDDFPDMALYFSFEFIVLGLIVFQIDLFLRDY